MSQIYENGLCLVVQGDQDDLGMSRVQGSRGDGRIEANGVSALAGLQVPDDDIPIARSREEVAGVT